MYTAIRWFRKANGEYYYLLDLLQWTNDRPTVQHGPWGEPWLTRRDLYEHSCLGGRMHV